MTNQLSTHSYRQLHHVVVGLETLVLLMFDSENKLRPPRLPQECLHGVAPKQCPESDPDGTYRCPSSNDVKYRMTRCTIDAIDFYLVESNTALNLWVSIIYFSKPIMIINESMFIFKFYIDIFVGVSNSYCYL